MASKGGDEMRETVTKIWGFLDQLADSDPGAYKRFIQKTVKERQEFLDPPQPIFCFSTGIRGKEHHMLYVNVCKWTRIPLPAEGPLSSVPVKGGILRYVVEDDKRRQNDLLIDIAFNPAFIQANIKDSDVMDMLLTVTLDFIDDYLSIITDRKTKILTESFKGPQQDIGFSLDHHNPELITRESWLDLSDTILSSMKKTWKTSKKDNASLPPLFPWQQQQQQQQQQNNSRHHDGAGPKLIEEVQQRGSTSTGQQSTKPKQKKKNRENCPDLSTNQSGTAENGARNEKVDGPQKDGVLDDFEEAKKNTCTPEHSVVLRQDDGGREVVHVCVKLPEVTSVKDISLDSTTTDMCLMANQMYFLSIPFPFAINPDKSKAKFSKRSQTLSVIFPAA